MFGVSKRVRGSTASSSPTISYLEPTVVYIDHGVAVIKTHKSLKTIFNNKRVSIRFVFSLPWFVFIIKFQPAAGELPTGVILFIFI